MPFASLGLIDRITRALREVGYEIPTEIQERAIPPALEGRDVIGRAKTGTGKTAAFALPILQRLELNAPPPDIEHRKHFPQPRRPVRALILTPTRELALQIDQAFGEYGPYVDVHTMTVYGGVRIDRQLRKLQTGVDVVVATPGRLLDHMGRKSVDLSHVEIFVLDEADRMFDMGFIDDVREIVRAIPRRRQTLLFSATMAPRIKHLAEQIQTDPVVIEVGEQRNPIESVTQHVYPTQRDRKLDLLKTILEDEKMDMVLVFTCTKDGADFVVKRLQHDGFSAMQIHSNLRQSERQEAMEGFRNGKYRVLVATDIAARGIDIDGISHVVNYDVPRYAEDYIHRIGRTGRADATGDAITFVGYEEEEFLAKIEDFIGIKFERKSHPGFDHGVVKIIRPKGTTLRRRIGSSRRAGGRKYK
jgi:ATP-dependent RNA helicase RhlE